jgi:hypothetical protein
MTSPRPVAWVPRAGRSAPSTALTRLRPLIRCAAHSAEIAEVGRPQTFSVYVLKKISKSRRPKRLTTQSSKLASGRIGRSRALT